MKANKKKETILKAAAECFSRYGFDKTTLEDIGKAAKLNKASLYYYFKNKEEIFMQVVLEESALHIEKLQQKVSDLSSTEEQVITYLSERLRYHRDVVNLNQLSLEMLQRVQPIFDQLYQIVWKKEVDFIENLLRNGKDKLSTDNTHTVAESIITIADALKHEEIRQADTMFASDIDYSEIEKKTKQIIQLIFKGLTT